jgi:hypothetical protein
MKSKSNIPSSYLMSPFALGIPGVSLKQGVDYLVSEIGGSSRLGGVLVGFWHNLCLKSDGGTTILHISYDR